MSNYQQSKSGNRLPKRIALVAALAIILIGFVWGDWVTRVFVLLAVVGAASGHRLGASKMAAGFSGMVAAALLAVPLGKALEGATGAALGLTGLTNRLFSITAVAVANLVIVSTIVRIGLKKVVTIRQEWRSYDRLAGAGVGLVQGGLIGCLLIWSVLFLEPFAAGARPPAGQASAEDADPRGEYVLTLARAARESAVGRAAEAVNPLDDTRIVALLQRGLLVLNDPVARDAFVQHPAVRGLPEYPSVDQAMDIFSADPQIQRLSESESDLAVRDIRALLDSPTLLRILDETSIVADLSPIAADIEQAINDALAASEKEPGTAAPSPLNHRRDKPGGS